MGKNNPMVGNLIKYGGLMVVVFLIAFFLSGTKQSVAPKTDEYDRMVKERQERGLVVAGYVAQYAIDPMLADPEERGLVLGAMVGKAKEQGKDILYASIVDKKGSILAHTDSTQVLQVYALPAGAKPLGDRGSVVQTLKSPQLGEYYEATTGIMLAETKIGEVHIGLKAIPNPAPLPPPPSPRKGIIIACLAGLAGVVALTMFGEKLTKIGPGAAVDAQKADQLKREEDGIMKRISEMRKEEETHKQRLGGVKRELADVTTQIDARKNELTQLKSVDTSKVTEEADALREEADALQRRLDTLKATDSKLAASIETRKVEDAALAQRIEQGQAAAQTQLAASKEDTELGQRIEAKKREELSLTMRIVQKRREEIAISQRLEGKRKEEIELMRRLEGIRKQTGKPPGQ
jgi:hypothetical protein